MQDHKLILLQFSIQLCKDHDEQLTRREDVNSSFSVNNEVEHDEDDYDPYTNFDINDLFLDSKPS